MSIRENTNTKIADTIWDCRRMMRLRFDVAERAPYANLIAYVAVLAKRNGVEDNDPLKKFKKTVTQNISSDILRNYLLSEIGEFWQRATNMLINDFTEEDLAEFVLTYDFTSRPATPNDEIVTPPSICDLALEILDIRENELVADLGCGGGRFLENAVQTLGNHVEVYGVDCNVDLACLAMARMEILRANYRIDVGDIFTNVRSGAFDKVFANFPFGVRVSTMKGDGEYYESMKTGAAGYGRPASADWLFNKVAFDSLKEDGTAVSIMTNGAAFNGSDQRARQYFVDNNMIKAVIALSPNLFVSTSISTTMVVLGHSDGNIRMVDATDLAIAGRRRNTLGEDEIKEILNRLSQDGNFSVMVPKERLAETDYNLYPSRYLGRDIRLENPMKLGELALGIERGARIPAQELDDLTIDTDSRITYLRLSDVTDGRISNDRPRLRQIDSSTERYWLKSGDLIISKNGAPFKIAIAEVAGDDIILANGNLYIIRLNTDIVNPYFVAAFLSSEDGKEILERHVVGTTIPNLPLKNLREIQIPVPPMERQKEIAEAYQASLDEIEILKIKIEKARIAASEAYTSAVAH